MYLVHLAEQNKRHGRLPLVDAIMSTRLASNYSTYWPIYGLKSNCIDSTIDRPNPYAITPPQVIRTTPISPTTARQHQLHQDVLPLLMRSRGYSLCCDFQCIHGFIARRCNVTLLSGTSSYLLLVPLAPPQVRGQIRRKGIRGGRPFVSLALIALPVRNSKRGKTKKKNESPGG